MTRHRLLAVVAGFLIVIGLITFPLPLPIGLPLIVVGGSLLLRVSPRSRRTVVQLIHRNPRLAGPLRRHRDSRRRRRNGRAR